MAAPVPLSRAWTGEDRGAAVLGRALAGRDMALGLGAILAMRHDAPVRGWVEAGGLADAIDLAATLLAWRSLPRASRWGVAAVTAGGAVAARLVSMSL